MSKTFDSQVSEDDLVHLLEEMKGVLTDAATGGVVDEEKYKQIRKVVLGIPFLKEQLPDYILKCRNLAEFWPLIKNIDGTYAGRRLYIAETINPLINKIEEAEIITDIVYERKELIGQGGFGQVYKVYHRLVEMDFALKIFAPAFANGDKKQLGRFFREARILFQLSHPNIIRVYDVGMMGKRPYIRMEFFPGKNLNDVLSEYGLITPDKALSLVKSVTSGLKHAHEKGIVHRDLKPSNILVAKPEQFKIIDFGIGTFIENDLVSRFTQTGEHVAGGHYTAPELVITPTLVDPRSDIYSLGAIWYNLIVGRVPVGNEKATLLSEAGIDSQYAGIILKCLEDIKFRYNSCSDLLQDLKLLS